MTSINFYKITSANTDKVYIGSTKQDINARLQIHERIIKDTKTVNFIILLLSKFSNVKTIKSNSSKIKFVKAKKNGTRLNVNILLIHLTRLINTFQGEHQNNIDKTIKKIEIKKQEKNTIVSVEVNILNKTNRDTTKPKNIKHL
jgi:hypothetical protein